MKYQFKEVIKMFKAINNASEKDVLKLMIPLMEALLCMFMIAVSFQIQSTFVLFLIFEGAQFACSLLGKNETENENKEEKVRGFRLHYLERKNNRNMIDNFYYQHPVYNAISQNFTTVVFIIIVCTAITCLVRLAFDLSADVNNYIKFLLALGFFSIAVKLIGDVIRTVYEINFEQKFDDLKDALCEIQRNMTAKNSSEIIRDRVGEVIAIMRKDNAKRTMLNGSFLTELNLYLSLDTEGDQKDKSELERDLDEQTSLYLKMFKE